MPVEHLYLWDEMIQVHTSEIIRVNEYDFLLHIVSASDDTHALLIVGSFLLDSDIDNLHSFLEIALARCGLKATFIQMTTDIFLASISPLHALLHERFANKKHGIIVLINGRESGGGNIALNVTRPKKGDTVQVIYKVS